MYRQHVLIAALALGLAIMQGCNESGGRLSDDDDDLVDDDDSAASNDDDSSDDDDSASVATGDDDDSSDKGGGDDDDSSNGETGDDDDSATVDPGLAFVNRTYCLDWGSVTFQSPAGIVPILGGFGVNLSDYPLLLSSTAVSIPVEEILMVLAAASLGSCDQDTSLSTYNLTSSQAGHYVAPHFEVGPSTIHISTEYGDLALYDAVFSGDFSGDATQVRHGSISGQLDISAYSSFLCGGSTSWACSPCPGGSGTCVDLLATDALWSDNNQGALLQIP